MAAPPGMTPQQMAALQQHMQQQIAAEAAKRGMTPEAFSQMQREQLDADAAKQGLTTEQYVNQMRMRATQQRAAQQQAQGQGQGQGQGGQGQGQPQQGQPQQQQVPVNPNNPPDPKAIAVAKWLRSQNLKTRVCILDGQRKDMFKGKIFLFSITRMRMLILAQSNVRSGLLSPQHTPKPLKRARAFFHR
jgi:translocation protein SEC62